MRHPNPLVLGEQGASRACLLLAARARLRRGCIPLRYAQTAHPSPMRCSPSPISFSRSCSCGSSFGLGCLLCPSVLLYQGRRQSTRSSPSSSCLLGFCFALSPLQLESVCASSPVCASCVCVCTAKSLLGNIKH